MNSAGVHESLRGLTEAGKREVEYDIEGYLNHN
jgi:hypothetical protein